MSQTPGSAVLIVVLALAGLGMLVAFRSGARKNSPQMADVAHEMNDNEIKAVADYIAGLR